MKPEYKVVESNIFDEVEYHFNCAVQILKNSMTGETSIGWTPMDSSIAEMWLKDGGIE